MKTVAVFPAVEQCIVWLPAAPGPQGHLGKDLTF